MCTKYIEAVIDGSPVLVKKGTLIKDCFLKVQQETTSAGKEIIASRVNNEFASLMDPVYMNCQLEPVFLFDTEGLYIYRESLVFLFAMAANQVFPDRRITICHSMGHGMLFQFQDNGTPAKKKNIFDIEKVMKALVKKDLPITTNRISWGNAVDYFQQQKRISTALLLKERNEPCVETWNCGNYISLRHNPLIGRTGLIYPFKVELFDRGFLLGYTLPNQTHPSEIAGEKLYKVYKEHRKWGEILGLSNISSLNLLTGNRKKTQEFIRTSEALQDRKLGELAGNLFATCNKIVLIAGPSSSGKTTFTKKLAINLKSLGLHPQLISLDDYYKRKDEIPLDKEGDTDYEALEALDLKILNRNIQELLAGKEAEIPKYKFKDVIGHDPHGKIIRLEENGILLFEGIHGLNPNLIQKVDNARITRIYISPLVQLNVDDYNRIPLTDNRLLRRLVRDHQFRGCTASDTLKMWPAVRRGEEQYIFPWQGVADYMFDTALDYEIAVLKVFAEPLLRMVSPDEKEYGEARRLMALLRNFSPLPAEDVPELSILREFIGRSGFRY